MDKQTLKQAAIKLGWIEDNFGHLKSPKGTLRIKLQTRSARVEKLYQPKPSFGYTPPKSWLNIVSDYYANIRLDDEGRILIKGKRLLNLNAAQPN